MGPSQMKATYEGMERIIPSTEEVYLLTDRNAHNILLHPLINIPFPWLKNNKRYLCSETYSIMLFTRHSFLSALLFQFSL